MKFTRHRDLDPQTRIEIVKDVWINQGIYGEMTQIARDYHISRTKSIFAIRAPLRASGQFRPHRDHHGR